METAARAGAADIQRITGVPVTFLGRDVDDDDFLIGSLAPIEVSVAPLNVDHIAVSLPHYGDVPLPADFYGGEITLFRLPSVFSDTALANVLRHEWGHQFNLGDLYDTRRTTRYDAGAPDEDFYHDWTPAPADTSLRMGDDDRPWGSGDKNGLVEASALAHDPSTCFPVIKPTSGRLAYRMLRALFGVPEVPKMAAVAEQAATDSAEAAAVKALSGTDGADWRATPRAEFIDAVWTGLTGGTPDQTTRDHYTDLWNAEQSAGRPPRPPVLAAMATSAAAVSWNVDRQEVSVVFANVAKTMPTASQAAGYASWNRAVLADQLFEHEAAARYEPGN
jgi:hypothetical protein